MIKLRKKDNRLNPFIIVDSIDEIRSFFNFKEDFEIIENDLDKIRFIEDLNKRRRLDAEVLSLIAANVEANSTMLDIGTYLGHSAARMAVNSPSSHVFTVNIHPAELSEGGRLVTGAPPVDEIGSFYRKKGLKNVTQIFANTKNWILPEEINNLSLVYVDGSHDKEVVYSDTKLIFDRVKKGGFILWHDCSPIYRENFEWINEAMLGVEKLVEENVIKGYIFNVRNSWVGIWRKNT